MIDIRKGGIAIYGAVIGAFVFGATAAKWRKVPLLPLFDLVSLGFPDRAGHWPLGQLRQSGGLRYKHDAATGACTARHGGRISNPCRSRCPRA